MSVIRVECECGGMLGILEFPPASEDATFQAVCPSCGTKYRRSTSELASRAEPERTVVVTLPRARPRG